MGTLRSPTHFSHRITCFTASGNSYCCIAVTVDLPVKVMDNGKARKARSPNIKHAVNGKKKKENTVLLGLVEV